MKLHSSLDTLRLGEPLGQARGAIILLHGRGASAEDIVGVLDHLAPPANFAFLAPNAEAGTWYPERFFVPLSRNEPWLSSALNLVEELIEEVEKAGIPAERIGLLGFSQGACLALETAYRNPRRYAFVAGLSGALIGPLDLPRPAVDLEGIPILLGCAEADPHIPKAYVEKSADFLTRQGAVVTKQIYPGGAHTLFPQEISWLDERFRVLQNG